MNENKFKYFAFISYSSKDSQWGRRLQRRLERYRLPSMLCREHNLGRRPMRPVFFAPTDIQPGDLSEELKQRLRCSKNLIVICSPDSAKSEWVGREIAYFHSLGRDKDIYFFIVSGAPHSGDSATECFNPIIEELGMPEILASNVHEKVFKLPWLNRERAYAQLISKLLGIEFDTIWQRHKRRFVENTIAWIVGIILIAVLLCGAWVMNRPVDIEFYIGEKLRSNSKLPQIKDAKIGIVIDDDTIWNMANNIRKPAIFRHIPQSWLGKESQILVLCKDFLTLDTTIVLTKNNELSLIRDANIYGDVRFRIWDKIEECYVTEDLNVFLDDKQLKPNNLMEYCISIPLEQQSTFYIIQCDKPLLNDTLFMPCGENPTLFLKD